MLPGASVPVGLEPVAVAARSNAEVWVVNHLSDSVSIVDVASSPPRVLRTLLVGDEPRDIVFAGSPERAFISTAHRGQQRSHSSVAAQPGAGDPQLTTEGVGRADVWVFDAASPGNAFGGLPIQILSFFADTPRALATDGTTVYVAALHSGNQTTAIPDTEVPDGFATSCGVGGVGQGVPGPSTSVDPDGGGPLPEPPAPETGVIVKFDGSDWVDALGCTWTTEVELDLPDQDVFAVNANTLAAGTIFAEVGTILFNMAWNPTTQKLYVSGTESPNHIRFEGPGQHGGSTVQGRLSESRIAVLDPTGPSVDSQHLNVHIDYSMRHTDPGADAAHHAAIAAQIPHSLATPLQVLVDDTNQKVYVAAFGSAKVGVLDVSELEDASFETNYDPTTESGDYLSTGGGPAGLALSGDRLYVYTRFANQVEVHDVSGAPAAPLQTVKLPSAEPASVVEGRSFLYDAVATSGNGEASCASCHIFGDLDGLGWNLGNPDDVVTSNPQLVVGAPGPGFGPDFHPMKGPMTTQTLRGLSTHSAMHWRGDRANGFFNADPPDCTAVSQDACDEPVSFENFIVAFEGLIGGHATIAEPEGDVVISAADMQKFADFALQLTLPPNPVANLDGTQTADQSAGETLYFNHPADGGAVTCNGCHLLDEAQGFFGTDGQQSIEGEPQLFKVAHLRNMVQKVGMFATAGSGAPLGPQVRGFGFLHDGSIGTMESFLEAPVFNFTGLAVTPSQARQQLEQFMLAFPSDVAPVVGQQVSLGPGNPGSTTVGSDANLRVDLLDARAGTLFDSLVLGGTVTECELIAKTVEGGVPKGYLRQADGSFLPDDGGSAISEASLRAKALAPDSQDLLFHCVPPGSGQRMGVDRDLDTVLDGLDNCPAWPNGAGGGTCTAGDAGLLAAACSAHADCGTGGFCSLAQEDADTDGTGDACEPALLPEPGVAGSLLCCLLALVALRRGGSRAR